MKLNELINVSNDSLNIKVVDLEGSKVACYDGKNTIHPIFNDLEVTQITADTDGLLYQIDLDYGAFYDRAYGDTWDDLPDSVMGYYTAIFMHMTNKELWRYDEYLWNDDNGCIIEDALNFALDDERIKALQIELHI